MNRLVKYGLIVAIFLLALIVAPMLIGEKGYILIAFGNYTIEMTIIGLAVMTFGVIVILVLVLKLALVSSTFTRRLLAWFKSDALIKRERLFYDALFALVLGNHQRAKEKLEKLGKDEFHGFNYLSLGQLAIQQNKPEIAAMWLEKAKQNSDQRCVHSAKLLTAELHIQQNAPAKALAELAEIKNEKDQDLIRIRTKALAQNNQWQELEEQLPKWKKVLGDNYPVYSEHIATNKFAEIASKQGANQLKSHWETLTRQQKNDDTFRVAYLQQLLHQGMHQDVLNYLTSWYKKKPLPILMLTVVKEIKVTQPAAIIGLLETSIKAFPEQAEYYAALGHIAYHCGDTSLSEKALLKALEMDETEVELLLLADLFESQNKYPQAMQIMRRVHAAKSS